MAGRTPGYWPDSCPVVSSGSVDSENEYDSEDASYPEPDLAFISELIETIERSPLAQEARVLLMQ